MFICYGGVHAYVQRRKTKYTDAEKIRALERQYRQEKERQSNALWASSAPGNDSSQTQWEIDTRGDADNLVFHSLYKSDVPSFRRCQRGSFLLGSSSMAPEVIRPLLRQSTFAEMLQNDVQFKPFDRYYAMKHGLSDRDRTIRRIRRGSDKPSLKTNSQSSFLRLDCDGEEGLCI